MRLKEKKALVTGGSRGIGRAIALAYASEGADVMITGRKMATLEPVAEELRKKAVKAYALEWDVTNIKDVDVKIAEIAKTMGGLDIVVNNAGVLKRPGCEGLLKMVEEDWDYVMNINLKSVYFICQAAANHMIENGIHGHIINISSEAGLATRGVSAPYGISKQGVIGITKGLAKVLMPQGVIMSGIAPGCVTTEMLDWKPGHSVESGPPYGRMNYPEEIADVAVFLASEAGSRIAGDTIVVGGGLK